LKANHERRQIAGVEINPDVFEIAGKRIFTKEANT